MTGPIEITIDEYERLKAKIAKSRGRQGWERWWAEQKAHGLDGRGPGQPPYGFRWKRVLVMEEDPYEQEVLAFMHEMFSAGLSNEDIAAVFADLGFLTRQAKPYQPATLAYQRKKLGYEPSQSPQKAPQQCRAPDCDEMDKPGGAKGYCKLHYGRLSRTGKLDAGRPGPSPKSHCPQGHPYDEKNTYITPTGAKSCRICNRDKIRRFYERHPEKKRKTKGSVS